MDKAKKESVKQSITKILIGRWIKINNYNNIKQTHGSVWKDINKTSLAIPKKITKDERSEHTSRPKVLKFTYFWIAHVAHFERR
jgi:hypothetical protein